MNHLQVISLTADQITVVEGRNPRIVLDNIEQLAESIEENGIRNPIKVVHVKTNQYELVDGHRRFAACQYLMDTKELNITIPAIVVDHYKSEADILVEMMVSNDSEPFAPFEEGVLYTRLKSEFALTTEQIAQRVGKSNSHVSDKIALLRADPAVRQAVAENKITASDATTIVRKSKGDTEKQRETIQRVEKEGRAAVIDQDLKKGRMPKTTWTLADATFDSAWSAMMGFGKDEAEKSIDAKDIHAWFEKNTPAEQLDLIELAFALGKLQVFADLSHTTLKELWKKLNERASGKIEE